MIKPWLLRLASWAALAWLPHRVATLCKSIMQVKSARFSFLLWIWRAVESFANVHRHDCCQLSMRPQLLLH